MTSLTFKRVYIYSYINNSLNPNLAFPKFFTSSCINKLPGPENENPGVKSAFSGSTRSLPDSFHDKQINPQPPFENKQIDIARKVRIAFYKEKPTTIEEIDRIMKPIKEERSKAIEQYEKELEEDAARYNKAAIKRAYNEEISTLDANHMVRESNADLKKEIQLNREFCEKELSETLGVVADIKEKIHRGEKLNFDNSIEDLLDPRGGTWDDFADTSTEMPDYTAGDD